MTDEESFLDGNAAAGLLQELLPFEVTTARTVCASCGAVDRLGALRAYVNAPGTVLRCLACESVQLRVARAGDRYWIDLQGVRCIELDAPL
jgi:hypothetical protein